MRTMCAMLDHLHGHLKPFDAEFSGAGRQFGYQALGVALGYVALSVRGIRFTHVRAGHSQQTDIGWKATAWFRPHTTPKELLDEAPRDVRLSLRTQ